MKLQLSVAVILALLKLADCLAISSLFGYLPQTLLYFKVSKTEVGAYVGLITRINLAGRFFGSISYGPALDRYDTVKILAFTQLTTAVFTLGLAFSVNSTCLIVFQFMIGFSNGGDMALRVLFKDISLDSYDLTIIYAVPTSLSLSIGPTIGGVLALPTEQYPHIFGSSTILEKMPTLLFNLLLSTLLLCNGLATMKLLSPRLRYDTMNHKLETRKPLLSTKQSHQLDSSQELADGCSFNNHTISEGVKETVDQKGQREWSMHLKKLCHRDYILCCLAINFLWCSSNTFFIIFPLWLGTPPSMLGMGFTPAETATVYFFPGLIAMALDIVLLGKINSWTSSKTGFALWSLLKSFVASTIIYLSAIQNRAIFSVTVCAGLTLVRFATSGLNTTSVGVINDSVPQDVVGIANAIALSTGSLVSTIFGVVLGKLYTWSVMNELHIEDGRSAFPFNRYFTFYVCGLMATLSAIFSAYIKVFSSPYEPQELNR